MADPKLLELAVKILIGAMFYVTVLWLAQRNPRATGMMLTFPTLNGIVLLMAAPSAIEETAGVMLLMPALNGVLCASYLHGFERLVERGTAPSAASVMMLAPTSAIWLLVAVGIVERHWSVPSKDQALYAAAIIVAGLFLTWALRPARLGRFVASSPQRMGALVHRNARRITLFTLTLAAVAAADRLGGPPALLGTLAGLPVVALFGLHAIAAEPSIPIGMRRDMLAAMAGTVWLGSGIAIVFIGAMWRVLAMIADGWSGGGTGQHVLGALALLAGWATALVVIWGISRLLPVLTRPHAKAETP